MIQEIKNIHDVIEFLLLLATEIKESNPFAEINMPGIYSAEEAAIRNELMEKCFEVCAKQNQNVKCLILVLFNEALTAPPVTGK